LDQQIRNSSEDLYETYKDTNYISAYCIEIPPEVISDPRERAAAALKAVEEFYGLFTLPESFPKSLVLAIIAQETGRYFDFNNELVSGDWGRGLMQITTDDYVGAGSSECESDDCWNCRERQSIEACYSYYSNTQEGINRNVRDGYYALEDKFVSPFEAAHCANCEACGENITSEEICWISNVQRYNTGYNIPTEYLWKVGERLQKLSYNWYYAEGVEDDSGLGNKFIEAYNNREEIILCSSAHLRVYDSQGRAAGLIEGEVAQEIPNSIYDREREIVIIFFPIDSYYYEVVGTDEGSYGLGVDSVEDGESTTFTAADIPTTSRAVHQYTIDWETLSQGGEGVTVQVDSDGDGKFEDTFTSDDELTQDEFLEETNPPLIGDFGSANNGPPDCKVDFEDLMIFALAYGSTSSDANWNPVCDIASEGGVLEPDGVIDFEDLMIFAMNYGKTCADL
jgi:hypothetical protein